VNILRILCTQVRKWKMRPAETLPGMGAGRKEKGEWWRGWIQA
jgi:hypothetical protein